MADPLNLLREFTVQKRPIKETDEYIIFGDYAWPKHITTNYAVWNAQESREYYTLDTLLFHLKHEDEPYHNYVKIAANQNKGMVRLADRRELIQYLHGGSEPKAIDKTVPVDISQRQLVAKMNLPENREPVQPINNLPEGILESRFLSNATPAPSTTTNSAMRNLTAIDELDPTVITAPKRPRVDEKLEKTVPATNLFTTNLENAEGSSLSRVIPADHLQELREKIRAKKRNQPERATETDATAGIAFGNEMNVTSAKLLGVDPAFASENKIGSVNLGSSNDLVAHGISSGVGSFSSLSKPFTPISGMDANFIQEVLLRERTWKNRINVLDSNGKTFEETIVNGILRNIKAKEEGRLPSQNRGQGQVPTAVHAPIPSAHAQPEPVAPAPVNQGAGYSRYEQERFTRTRDETAGFQIDTMGSYHGQGLSSMMATGSTNSQSPAKSSSNKTPSNNAAAAVGGSSAARATAAPMIRDPRSGALQALKSDNTANYRSVQEARVNRTVKSRTQRIPIIIIPATPTSLITMYNAKDILQDLRYVTMEQKKASGYQRETELMIQRQKSDGTTAPYRIVDQPMRLAPEEWDRVVAVFAQGPAWQFKGWPIGADPIEIFMKVKAFHLRWSRQPLDPNIEKWNVTVLNLDERRHLDKANFQQFWDQLDKHIAKIKPYLRY